MFRIPTLAYKLLQLLVPIAASYGIALRVPESGKLGPLALVMLVIALLKTIEQITKHWDCIQQGITFKFKKRKRGK